MLSPRPTRTDVLLAVGVLAVLVGSAFVSRSGLDRPVDALGLSMLAAIAVATLVRRRWPVVVLALCTALIFGYYVTGFPPVGLELPLAAPVATVAAAGRWRLAVLWSVAVTAFAYGSRIALGQDPVLLLALQLPTTVAVLGGAIAIGDAVRSRRELRAEQERTIAAARREAEQRTAQRLAAERVRLARDLHDVLGHTVAVVSLHADVAEEAVAAGDTDGAAEAIRAIRGASGTAMRDLRGAVQLLRGDDPATLDVVGGLAAIGELVDGARSAGLDVELDLDLDPTSVPAPAGMTAYRVVQEGLTNVLRHAGAAHAWVVVTSEPGALLVRVEDDGRGLPDAPTEGTGLRGMAERVALLGGTLRTGARRGGAGTRVTARIPT